MCATHCFYGFIDGRVKSEGFFNQVQIVVNGFGDSDNRN